jgi:peptide/nickel transport system substrate-binding protein
MQRRAGIRRWAPVVAAIMAMSLIAAACGGSSSSNSNQEVQGSDVTVKASGAPKMGGAVKFGIEGESDGFNPTKNRWAISGYMVGSSVFDPLAAYDATGKPQPYLAKAFTPSADFKTWTVELRPGVTFSDGTPVDAAAVKKDLDAVRADPLIGIALNNIAATTVVSPTQLTISTIDPWASMPAIQMTRATSSRTSIPSSSARSSIRRTGSTP